MQDEKRLYHLLRERGLTLSTAESCSGGLLSHRLTNVPGISEVFLLGVVSYSNDTKVRVLGVDEEVLRENGAVSPEVAMAMAGGVQRLAGSDFGIGITGIAGPTGGTVAKPVGTVFIGVSWPQKGMTEAWHFLFRGDRTAVKTQTVEAALAWVCRLLAGND